MIDPTISLALSMYSNKGIYALLLSKRFVCCSQESKTEKPCSGYSLQGKF
jgi:hypothetical protein